jgi:hypothetical protein
LRGCDAEEFGLYVTGRKRATFSVHCVPFGRTPVFEMLVAGDTMAVGGLIMSHDVGEVKGFKQAPCKHEVKCGRDRMLEQTLYLPSCSLYSHLSEVCMNIRKSLRADFFEN